MSKVFYKCTYCSGIQEIDVDEYCLECGETELEYCEVPDECLELLGGSDD